MMDIFGKSSGDGAGGGERAGLRLVAFVCLLAAAFFAFGRSGRAPDGAAFAEDKDYELLDVKSGAKVTAGSLFSDCDYLWLVFSTPSCPYCREEVSELAKNLKNAPKDRVRVAVLFPDGSSDLIKSVFYDRWKINSPHITAYQDAGMEMFGGMVGRGVPVSYIFRAQSGELVGKYEGYPGADAVAGAVRELLSGS